MLAIIASAYLMTYKMSSTRTGSEVTFFTKGEIFYKVSRMWENFVLILVENLETHIKIF